MHRPFECKYIGLTLNMIIAMEIVPQLFSILGVFLFHLIPLIKLIVNHALVKL